VVPSSLLLCCLAIAAQASDGFAENRIDLAIRFSHRSGCVFDRCFCRGLDLEQAISSEVGAREGLLVLHYEFKNVTMSIRSKTVLEAEFKRSQQHGISRSSPYVPLTAGTDDLAGFFPLVLRKAPTTASVPGALLHVCNPNLLMPRILDYCWMRIAVPSPEEHILRILGETTEALYSSEIVARLNRELPPNAHWQPSDLVNLLLSMGDRVSQLSDGRWTLKRRME